MKPPIAAALLMVVALVPTATSSGAPSFRVKGRSLATVYLDAGRAEGLRVGDRVRVVSGETTVAEMEIVAVNQHVAACRLLSVTRPVGRGDVVVPVTGAASARGKSPSDTEGPTTVAIVPPATGRTSSAPTTTVAADGPPKAVAAPPAATSPTFLSRTPVRRAPSAVATPEGGEAAPRPGASPASTKASAPPPAGDERPAAAAGVEPPTLTPVRPDDAASRRAVGTSVATDPVRTSSSSASVTRPSPSGQTPPVTVDPEPATGPAPDRPPLPPQTREAALTRPSTPGSDASAVVAPGTPAASAPVAASEPRASSPSAPGFAALVSASDAPSAASTTETSATAAAAPKSSPARRRGFKVKYRSAASVYLDAGRAEGLDVGDQLEIVAGQTTVARLEVVYAAELSASCKVLSEERPVHVGDLAVPLDDGARDPTTRIASDEPSAAAREAGVVVVAPTPASTSTVSSSASRAPGLRWGRLRGAASLGFYRSWDHTESALDFEQRTARLDLSLYDIAGEPLSFTVRARSRQDIRARTLSARTPRDERTDRLYELALRYEPLSDEIGFEVGRIGLYRFVGIGYLDGALARFQPTPGLQVGAFGGRQAEIESLGFGGTGDVYGGFVRLAPSGRYAMGGHDVLLAYVRENAEGDVSREYLSLESSLSGGSRWSLFQRAELDLNRGWRQEITGKSHQLSNISLSGNLRLAPSSWAFVSYDGRRNYRYYRNRLVPEEVFDDLLHQGLRAGVTVAKPGGFGATAGLGMTLKESDPRHPELDLANAYSFNAGVRHSNLLGSGLSFGLDGSGFTNGYADGGLVSARLGWRLGPGHLLDFSYGYSLYRVTLTDEDRVTQWLRFVGRAELTRRLYLLGDFEYDAGDDLQGPRGFLEFGVVF